MTSLRRRSGTSAVTAASAAQVYRLLDRGLLDSIKIDDMRLILMDSYRQLIERSRVPPKQRASAD
jgi:hypothetical protein